MSRKGASDVQRWAFPACAVFSPPYLVSLQCGRARWKAKALEGNQRLCAWMRGGRGEEEITHEHEHEATNSLDLDGYIPMPGGHRQQTKAHKLQQQQILGCCVNECPTNGLRCPKHMQHKDQSDEPPTYAQQWP